MELRRQGWSFLLIFILLFLQYRLWIEPGGVIDMARLKKRLVNEEQQNDQLRKRNQELITQVKYLQKNPNAIESRARQELGMIKKGEKFYQVVR